MDSNSPLVDILPKIIAQPVLHAQFLYHLAHLEYVGSRKIAKALPAVSMSANHLEHLQEEAGHAFLLRREAEALGHPQAVDRTKEVEAYLQSVDHGIADVLDQHFKTYKAFETYLVVSLIIEERAMEFYPLYHRLLPDGSVKTAVHGIMKDEVGHLEDMRAACQRIFTNAPQVLNTCRAVEKRAYAENFMPVIRQLLA